eukprot:TRINITY_DN1013_c0_g1_i1.p1 TRINITY_DN1013_c0_g1~~TRINITY_DN1013_c0_g1_i1.p1  ORF type:complete len:1118 (-),score=182.22 TRINITY_DN1013_c0_g1_i1:21-3374(-)
MDDTARVEQFITALRAFQNAEQRFVRDLQTCVQIYQQPLQARVGTKEELLTRDQMGWVFGPMESFYQQHSQIQKALDERLVPLSADTANAISVGDIFANLQTLAPLYKDYYSGKYEHGRDIMIILRADSKRVNQFLETVQRQAPGRQFLEDYLLRPLLRLYEYRETFQELQKLTHPRHSSRHQVDSLDQGLREVERLIRDVDTRKQSIDAVREVQLIHRKFIPPPGENLSQQPFRTLAGRAVAQYDDAASQRSRPCYLHIFSDFTTLSVPLRRRFLVKHVFYHNNAVYSDLPLSATPAAAAALRGSESALWASVRETGLSVRIIFATSTERDTFHRKCDEESNRWRASSGETLRRWQHYAATNCPNTDKPETRNEPAHKPREMPRRDKTAALDSIVVGLRQSVKTDKKWKQRTVTVRGDTLSVTEANGTQTVPQVDLRQALLVKEPEDWRREKPYCCELITRGEAAVVLAFTTQAQLQEWLALLIPGPSDSGNKIEAAATAVESEVRRAAASIEKLTKARFEEDARGQLSATRAELQQVLDILRSVQTNAAQCRSETERLVDALQERDRHVLSLSNNEPPVPGSDPRVKRLETQLIDAQSERDALDRKLQQALEAIGALEADSADIFAEPWLKEGERAYPNYGKPHDRPASPTEFPRANSGLPPIAPTPPPVAPSTAMAADARLSAAMAQAAKERQEMEERHRAEVFRLQQECDSLASALRESRAAQQRAQQSLTEHRDAVPVVNSYTAEYSLFLHKRSELVGWLREQRAHFIAMLHMDFKTADLPEHFRELSEYEQRKISRKEIRQELERMSKTLQERKCPLPTDLSELDRLGSNLDAAETEFVDSLHEEDHRRKVHAQRVTEFFSRIDRFIQWCRTQYANLEALHDPDHIQQFEASLQNNISQMESNLQVVTEMGEALLPDKSVEDGLLEAAEVWLQLQVYAYEKLQQTLLEIHHNSKLEDEVRNFAAYSRRVKKFLVDIEKLFGMQLDEESRSIVRPAMQQCRDLQHDFGPHNLLTDHLADFSLRMECIRDNYAHLKAAVLSKLTFVTRRMASAEASYARQKEFDQCIERLTDWVHTSHRRREAPSITFGGWAPLQKQVDALQALVQQELKGRQ